MSEFSAEPQQPSRTSEIFLHIGKRNTGKTYMTEGIIADFYRHGRRVIIFDINNQSEYDKFSDLTVDEIPYWREIEIVKVREPDRVNDFFDNVHFYVRNALVILEDSTSYVMGNIHKSIQRLVLNTRNANNELYFNVHSLSDPGPFLYKHVDWYILRETGDEFPLDNKVRAKGRVERAMREIKAENKRLYPDVAGRKTTKRAYRILDPTD